MRTIRACLAQRRSRDCAALPKRKIQQTVIASLPIWRTQAAACASSSTARPRRHCFFFFFFRAPTGVFAAQGPWCRVSREGPLCRRRMPVPNIRSPRPAPRPALSNRRPGSPARGSAIESHRPRPPWLIPPLQKITTSLKARPAFSSSSCPLERLPARSPGRAALSTFRGRVFNAQGRSGALFEWLLRPSGVSSNPA